MKKMRRQTSGWSLRSLRTQLPTTGQRSDLHGAGVCGRCIIPKALAFNKGMDAYYKERKAKWKAFIGKVPNNQVGFD